MDIVSQNNVLVAARVGRYSGRVPVLGVLDQLRTVVLVVLGVNVLVHNMVTESGHLSETARSSVALEIWSTHVSRDPTKQVAESHLVVDHLRCSDGAVYLIEIAMGPGVAGNVVACSVHAPHHSWPWEGRIVHVSLGPVVSSHEESGLDIFRVQKIQKVIGVGERAIIECEGNHTGGCASLDDASIRDTAKFGARNALGAASTRPKESITRITVFELAS